MFFIILAKQIFFYIINLKGKKSCDCRNKTVLSHILHQLERYVFRFTIHARKVYLYFSFKDFNCCCKFYIALTIILCIVGVHCEGGDEYQGRVVRQLCFQTGVDNHQPNQTNNKQLQSTSQLSKLKLNDEE